MRTHCLMVLVFPLSITMNSLQNSHCTSAMFKLSYVYYVSALEYKSIFLLLQFFWSFIDHFNLSRILYSVLFVMNVFLL